MKMIKRNKMSRNDDRKSSIDIRIQYMDGIQEAWGKDEQDYGQIEATGWQQSRPKTGIVQQQRSSININIFNNEVNIDNKNGNARFRQRQQKNL